MSKNKKYSFFIGLSEIANIVATYSAGFQMLGHKTYTAVNCKNPYFTHEQYDVLFNQYSKPLQGFSSIRKIARFALIGFIKIVIFIKALINCDTFIFSFGSSFFPFYIDYPIIKLLGKKIVSVFCGCDIRHWSTCEAELEILGLNSSFKSFCNDCNQRVGCHLKPKLEIVKASEKYSSLILSQRNLSQLLTRPYMRVTIPLNLSSYSFNVPARDIPIIVHAPSDRSIKGTNHILAIIERLKKDGIIFEFRLIENTDNAEVRKILYDSDIVVDALFGQTIGMLALESMATGNAVLSSTRSDYELVPGECPVISINESNLYQELLKVIVDKKLRIKLAYAGRKYVETHHDHTMIANQIAEWLEPGGIQKYDYYPDFALSSNSIPTYILGQERDAIRQQRIQKFNSILRKLRLHHDT